VRGSYQDIMNISAYNIMLKFSYFMHINNKKGSHELKI